jgi:hypothetical protein
MIAPLKIATLSLSIVAFSFAAAHAQEVPQKQEVPVVWSISEAPAAAALDIGRSENSPPSVDRERASH